MENTHPVKTLISQWPSRKALADDIGVQLDAVHKWAQTGRIPSAKQKAVIDAAAKRGITFATADWMLEAHSERGVA